MSLFAIGDLHLAIGEPDKTMEAFGGRWNGYVDKIRRGFDLLHEDDTCVICGDFCWAMSLAEALPDFQFLNSLPGKKLMVKGNHDYWWTTAAKMNAFFAQNGLDTISLLHNNSAEWENLALCGTRGWPFEEDFSDPHNEKIFRRELLRLEASLRLGAAEQPEEIICFLHYPPLYSTYRCEAIVELLKKYGVKRCVYGHLHGNSLRYAVTGEAEGIEWKLVSGDFVDFTPVFLKK